MSTINEVMESQEAQDSIGRIAAAIALDEAIRQQVPVELSYRKADAKTPEARIVSPSELWEAKDSSFILSAFDHGRDEPRSFRLDRIESVSEPSESVEFVEMPTRD